jgi:hypothetical protein
MRSPARSNSRRFAVVEALRFGAAAAARDRGSAAGLFPGWHAWLGYGSAALLFVSASAAPYNVDGTNRLGPVGLAGWLGWIAWVVVSGSTLLAL